MAISDVLWEAHDEIGNYLDAFPDSYAEFRDEIVALLTAMEALRAKLDTAPEPQNGPEGKDSAGDLRKAPRLRA